MNINTVTVATKKTWTIMNILFIIFSFALITIALASSDNRFFMLLFSLTPLILIVNAQILTRTTDVFSPLSFAFLTTFLGVTLQTFYLLFNKGGANAFQLYGHTTEILLNGLIAINLGIIFFILGFISKAPKINISRMKVFKYDNWKRFKLSIVIILCIFIGVVSISVFFKEMSILSDFINQFSVKRKVTLDSGQSAAFAYLRWGAQLFQISFILYYSHRLIKKRHTYTSTAILFFLALLSVALPFISSNRSDILYFVITILMLKHYLVKAIPIKIIITFFSISVLIVILMGALRYVQQRGLDSDAYSERIGLNIVYETVADSGNFLGIGKTSVIIKSVPEIYEYELGRTFFLWMIAPIPRSLWAEKPIISIGGELGHKIFNTSKNTGIPPGFIGELFLNFGWFGIPFGMFILGAWLKFLYVNLLLRSNQNKNAVILYIAIILPFSLMLLNSNFSGVIIRVLQTFIPLIFFLTFITRKNSI